MRLLLDTHALLWWMSGDSRLGPSAAGLIADPHSRILVSVVSLWEIVVKVRVGKLRADVEAIEREMRRSDFERLAISGVHLTTLALLPTHRRDPFDHLLIAQAISEDATLVSDDDVFIAYAAPIIRCASR